jgi:hypothetical protein
LLNGTDENYLPSFMLQTWLLLTNTSTSEVGSLECNPYTHYQSKNIGKKGASSSHIIIYFSVTTVSLKKYFFTLTICNIGGCWIRTGSRHLLFVYSFSL